MAIGAVSIWEMRLKWSALYALGDRKGPLDPAMALKIPMAQSMDFLPLTAAHAALMRAVPIPHRDQFDELLLVQAQAENLRLLTRSRTLVSHPLAIRV